MFRRMTLGVFVVFVCASLVQAAEPKLGFVRTLVDPVTGEEMDGGAVLIFQPSDAEPLMGRVWLFALVRGLNPEGTYLIDFERPGVGGYFTANLNGTGYVAVSDEPIVDPTPLPVLLPDNYMRVWDMDGMLVAEGKVE